MPTSFLRHAWNGLERTDLDDEFFTTREIFLNGNVTAESMTEFIKQLIFLDRQDPASEITVYISSLGGDVKFGLAAYDVMKLIRAPIRTVCTGLSASMGAILFLAGDRREMLPHSEIMLHDPSPGGGSMAGMKPADMEVRLQSLRDVQNALCSIIAEVTGKSMDEVKVITAKDSFFNAESAVRELLATGIITSNNTLQRT